MTGAVDPEAAVRQMVRNSAVGTGSTGKFHGISNMPLVRSPHTRE